MNDIYEEAVQGYEVTEATASRIRGLIRDAWDLEIVLSGLGIFVEVLPQPPYGVRKVLGRFNSMLEAQNFAWAWLTGPYGVVKDVRFIKVAPGICGIDFDVLIRDIRSYLGARIKGDQWPEHSMTPVRVIGRYTPLPMTWPVWPKSSAAIPISMTNGAFILPLDALETISSARIW